MAEIITMLALSPTMEEGTIAEWHKKEGDSVEEGEIIAEVETDKATMEMESFFEGTVLKVLVKPGDTVKVGAPMAVIGEAGEDADAALAGLGGAPADDAAPAEEEAQEEQVEEELDEPSAPAEERVPSEKRQEAEASAKESGDGARIKVSPLARKIAEEKGISLDGLKGSGPGGRIIKQDVEEAGSSASTKKPATDKAAAPAKAAPAAAASAPSAEPTLIGELPDAGATLEPLSQMRKAIARRMVQVWQNTPFFYLTMEIDMAPAMAKRSEFNAQLKEAGVEVKISVNDMIVRACALALRDYPRMNCAFAGTDGVAFFDQVHVGVAVALEDGLITPTIRDADKKTLSQIAQETRALAEKARDKKLKPGEFGGSTFSISNLGMYGIDHFQAVINPPESGILACGAVQQVPVVKDGELAVGTRMKITLTCDHRAVDGAIGAEFLQHVKKRLENPILLLI